VVYNVPRSTASFLSGLIVVPGAVIGTVIGGILGERGHKNLRDSALFNMKCAIISCTLLVGIFFFRCPLVKYNGLNYATSPPEVSGERAERGGGGVEEDEKYRRATTKLTLFHTITFVWLTRSSPLLHLAQKFPVVELRAPNRASESTTQFVLTAQRTTARATRGVHLGTRRGMLRAWSPKVSERSERASWKNLAKWLQTATSTTKLN